MLASFFVGALRLASSEAPAKWSICRAFARLRDAWHDLARPCARLVVPTLLAAAGACGHGASNAWQTLPTGVELQVCAEASRCALRLHDAPEAVAQGGGRVAVLRLSAALGLRVHADAHAGCAPDWTQVADAAVVFNAGFYDRQHRHVGLLRSAGSWHQAAPQPDWLGLLASDPNPSDERGPGTLLPPRTRLFDWQRDAVADAVVYPEQAQSMVLFDANHTLRCRYSAAAASRCAVASDDAGTLYVVVTQGAWTLHALADWLQRTYPALTRAINLDGGHEAQLAVRTPGGNWAFLGEHGGRSRLVWGCRALPFVWTLSRQEAGWRPASDAP